MKLLFLATLPASASSAHAFSLLQILAKAMSEIPGSLESFAPGVFQIRS
jgi:hypothetical protein